MIYTGYYAKTKLYKEKGIHTIAISGKIPDFYQGDRWLDLAPRYGSFKRWKDGEIDNFEYMKLYREWLNCLDKEQVKKDLLFLLEAHENIIFLCFEKSGDFCHRHILADWIEENFKLRVEEYEVI